MALLVMKFGGTSVADLARIEHAAKKVEAEVARGYDVIVIVSAMSGKTNELVGWVETTSTLYDAREYDAASISMALGFFFSCLFLSFINSVFFIGTLKELHLYL